jgi:hypothetical protein
MSNFYPYLIAQGHEHEMWSHLMRMETYINPQYTWCALPEKLVQWMCPPKECPNIQHIVHPRCPTCMHEKPPALKYMIKKYPMYNSFYQLSGPIVDEYGLQRKNNAWMKDKGESFDGTECFGDISESEVARKLRIQEEINAQSYCLADGGENDEPGAFVLDPEYPVFRPPCPEMSPDDPVYEEPLVEAPIKGLKLHPPNMAFGLPGKTTCTVWKTHSAACSVLTPHFEEIDTSSLVEKEKLRI